MKEALGQRSGSLLMAGIAIALLIPCFWQPHIQAGDLPSHVYNAWLAGQVERGAIPGLTLVHPTTNVLADWLLQVLSRTIGATWAERLVVAAAVQIFFWGAFAWITVIQNRRPWIVVSFLGMLAYGLIFHFGFLNFYLSTGLTLCMMALLWHPSRRRYYVAVPLAVLAFLAHPLPLVWGIFALAYVAVARRLNDQMRVLLLPTAFSLLILIQTGLTMKFQSQWSVYQFLNLEGLAAIAGAEQFWLYGTKYLLVVAGVLVLWSVLLLERVDRSDMLSDPIVHLWLLNIAALVLLPGRIDFPGYQHGFVYIPQRVSLFIAILFCAMASGGRYGRGLTRLSAIVALAYFTFMYADHRALNRIEAKMSALTAGLSPGERFVAALQDSGSERLNGLIHVGSAACLGHCFDYANYEPATAQFQIRVQAPNAAAAPNMEIVQELEQGKHIVRALEAPIYSVCSSNDAEQQFFLKKLGAGERTCVTSLAATPQFF